MSFEKINQLEKFFFVQINSDCVEKKDIILIEGAPKTHEDILELKLLRKHADTIISVGACSNLASVFTANNKPISHYIKVDYEILGCPIDLDELVNALMDIYWDKVYQNPSLSVCFECKQNQNQCRLKNNQSCFGPVTKSGCNSICINYHTGCTGCRGLITEPNIKKIESISSIFVYKDDLAEIEALFLKKDELIKREYFNEPFITSRKSGLNSFAHSICSGAALEKALGFSVSKEITDLRELLLSTEIIRNHLWILYSQSLTKLFGFKDFREVRKNHPEIADKLELLINFANSILEQISGRNIHPVTNIVGGITHIPAKKTFKQISLEAKRNQSIVKEIAELLPFVRAQEELEKTNLTQTIKLLELIQKIIKTANDLAAKNIAIKIKSPKRIGRGLATVEFSDGLLTYEYLVGKNDLILNSKLMEDSN
jgi:coenzyme F420-reducing hydrogenase gamma subunit